MAPGEAAPGVDREGLGPAEQRLDHDLATPPATGRNRRAAAILSGTREGIAVISGTAPKLLMEGPGLKKRLPLVKEFSAAGGDWVAFSHRFTATCEMDGQGGITGSSYGPRRRHFGGIFLHPSGRSGDATTSSYADGGDF
ncbi:unnamed protein product [Lampetra fluviatilis]